MRSLRPAIVALFLSLLSVAVVAADDPVILVHEQRPEEDLSVWRMRILMNGAEPLWGNGDRVRLLLPPEDSPATAERLYEFLERSPRELRKIWVDKVFKGEAVTLPEQPPTVEDLIRELRSDPGGLGVLPGGAVSSGVPEGLKILTVDGKQPGDDGYALASGS